MVEGLDICLRLNDTEACNFASVWGNKGLIKFAIKLNDEA